MTSFLLIWVGLLVAFQPSIARFYAAGIFSGIVLLHEFFINRLTLVPVESSDPHVVSDLDGVVYYMSAILFSALIVAGVTSLKQITQTALNLARLALWSMAINFIGFLFWYFGLSPKYYVSAFMIFYCAAIAILLGREKLDVGGINVGLFTYRWVRAVVRRINRASCPVDC